MIAVDGYEVLINTTDANWGFELRPTLQTGQRTWWFRAASEDERLEWAQRLVAATYLSSGPGSAHASRRLGSPRFGVQAGQASSAAAPSDAAVEVAWWSHWKREWK